MFKKVYACALTNIQSCRTPTDPLKIYARANSSPSVIKPSAVGEGLEGKGSGGSGALEFWGGEYKIKAQSTWHVMLLLRHTHPRI